MTDSPQACYECGSQGSAADLQRRRIKQPKQSGKGHVFSYIWLCPECVARYDAAPAAKMGRCDNCGAQIVDGAGHIRSRTETEHVGNWVRHHTVNMLLCPDCAASHDSAGGHLIKGMLIFVGVLLFLACG